MASVGSPVIREKGSIGTAGKQEKEELGRRQLDETWTQARGKSIVPLPPLFSFMRVSLENRRPTTWMSSSVDRIGFEAAYMLTTNQFQSVRMGPWWGRIRGTWR